jgi:GLPGLI family protein
LVNLRQAFAAVALVKINNMEKFIIILAAVFTSIMASAQVKEGKIIYERTQQLQIQLSGQDQAMQSMIPKERKDRFEWIFGNSQSVWKAVEEVDSDGGNMSFSSGGAEIRMIMPGSNDIIFTDFVKQQKVEQRELMTKTFVVADSIRRMNWKLGEESKTILGYTCRKAIAQKTQQSFRVTMDNGNMERKEVTDTLNIVAWFTDGIGLSGGPESYAGQLPGTILEIEVNNGRTHFLAIEFDPKGDMKQIKEPKGKKITPEEFKVEREKMMQEMQKNNGGTFNIKSGG